MITPAEIKQIFPEANFSHAPRLDSSLVEFKIASQTWCSLEKTSFNQRELVLLDLMSQPKEMIKPNNRWYSFLFEQGDLIDYDSPVRLLQFNVHFTDFESTPDAWQAALLSMFAQSVEGFWLNATMFILIEPNQSDLVSDDDLMAMLHTVDADFFTDTTVFIGHVWTVDSMLPVIFKDERRLFKSNPPQKVNHITNTIFEYLFTKKVRQQPVFVALKAQIKDNQQNVEMILMLYQQQGNLKSTAEHLYIHRNTLLYRLDKFNREVGFNLKEMDDLVFCHLLLT
ncbi:hypothetical protein [Lactobacillus curvatus] [Lactiplantibacillus mudanjiangensis]|uniref:helix-turn-helix domain-containing protein n=1 Tax=Lactiplantibacillus mudanjiangensis TaxID=1296538 RepID=UPI001015B659|nr:helix-turn-helix domain-containing protein [Lactiplantibacillus mudanjiangensis]VDG20803.1 hypothetical protein [Lactobacillus curvatus] [Lactiplantibacillus mudanjiangensis]VDG32068.1 hypothetical protein [Lactobacillus curvatus] [Lactiplantibacillus mudanjiangensis]